MNPDSLLDIGKGSHVQFQEEIPCVLVANKHLVVNIRLTPSDDGMTLVCDGEMDVKDFGLSVRVQRSLSSAAAPETTIMADLRDMLVEKILEELAMAESHFSDLEMIRSESSRTAPLMKTLRSSDTGSGYLRTRPPGEPSNNGYLRPASIRPHSPASSGGYLPSSIHRNGNATPPREIRPPIEQEVFFERPAIRTNYTEIEKCASRILHLKETIKGIAALRDRSL